MATNFIFVRHAANELINTRIAGRTPGLDLNEKGTAQAQRIADALIHLPIDAIIAGPLERTCETAHPLCTRLGLPLQRAPEFSEIDFGDWTNQRFEALEKLPQWRHWNAFRSFSAVPKGEMMLEVQARVVRKLIQLQAEYRCAVIFSHGDVIRATLAYFLGTPLDFFLRIRIDAASISVVEIGHDFARVRLINGSADAPVHLERE